VSAQDQWANYLDPETPSDDRDEIAAELADHEALALDRIGAILSDDAVWGSPSDDLRAGLMAQALSEAGPVRPDDRDINGDIGDDVGGDRPSGGNGRVRRLGWFSSGALVAAAAAAILFFAATRPADDGDVTTYEVAGTELTPDVEATADVEPLAAGVAITLNISGLPPAGDGEYYAAWLMRDMDPGMDDGAMDDDMDDGAMVGIGSFHWREGGIPIELWSGVDTERYPIFVVTLQDEEGPPTASDIVVMTGRLSDQ